MIGRDSMLRGDGENDMNSRQDAFEIGEDDFPPDRFFERSLSFNLRRSFNRVTDEIDHALSDYALSAHQYGVLTTIYFERAKTPSEVARLRFQNGAAITYTLDRLEQRGLLERVRSDSDRRVITLALTSEGRELTRKCMASVIAAQDRLSGCLSPIERERLFDMLLRICDS